MTSLAQRLPPLRSRKYLNGAKGSPCTFMGPTCNGNPETTVFAHLNGAAFGKGKGQKAHDIAGLDACHDCHTYIDVGHGTKPLMTDAEFYWHLLRGVVLTVLNRARSGVIVVPLDPERLVHSRPSSPRKPAAERTKIPHRKTDWPTRPLVSRNTLRKSSRTEKE